MIEEPNEPRSRAIFRTVDFDVDVGTVVEASPQIGREWRSALTWMLDGACRFPGTKHLVVLDRDLLQFLPIQHAGVDGSIRS